MDTKDEQKQCYVIMGFGRKTDFETGRILDLDKSYRILIKPAVEAAGLQCVRADEIVTHGLIEMTTYNQLLKADLVIADVSTSNRNAYYELGIRHALRPFATIVIADDSMKWFPFNLVPVLLYHHLGEDIGLDEAMRFRKLLTEVIQRTLANEKKGRPDSPVYTLLEDLQPPMFRKGAGANLAEARIVEAATTLSAENVTLAALREQGEQALRKRFFSEAKALFQRARQLNQTDSHLIRQHVLATYKARQPDPISALVEARKLLNSLSPDDSTDRETLELLGDIELALFNEKQGVHHLASARWAYERLHTIKGSWHSSITLAYLVAQHAEYRRDRAEKIADLFWAERLRHEAVEYGKQRLAEIRLLREHKDRWPEEFEDSAPDMIRVWGAISEAYYGLGDNESYLKARDRVALSEGGEEVLTALDASIQRLTPLLGSQAEVLAAARSGETPATSAAKISAKKPEPSEGGAAKPAVSQAGKPARDLIFISYSHENAEWLGRLKKALAPVFRNKNISLWDDGHIKAGENWREEIKNALSRAKGAVLLVSSDFLASEFIAAHELPYILENAGPEGVTLLWVAIDDCLYEGTDLEKYQCLNDPKKPLTTLDPIKQSSEVVTIARKIRDRALPE